MLGQTGIKKLRDNGNDLFKPPLDSDVILGGVPIIALLRDFKPFTPVKDPALWNTKVNYAGKVIWLAFDEVVILTEQMKKKDDLEYQSLLEKSRKGTMGQVELVLLNKQVTSVRIANGEVMPKMIKIVKENKKRAQINHNELLAFAKERKQTIFLFPSANHLPKAAPNQMEIHEQMLAATSMGKWKGDGFFQYSKGMPAALMDNVYTKGNLMNGTQGTVENVVLEANPDSKIKLPQHESPCMSAVAISTNKNSKMVSVE